MMDNAEQNQNDAGEATEIINLQKNRIEELEQEKLEKEELKAKIMIGGGSEAGQPKEKPKEETPKDYAKRILSGK